MGTAGNEEKKQFLWGYRDSVRRMQRIRSEIEEIRELKMSASTGGGSSGRKGWKSDLSGYMANLDGLERSLDEEWKTRIQAYKKVKKAIESVENAQEQDVLFYKYIKGMAWWEIAEKMNYSERHIRRLHGRALLALEVKAVTK